MKLLFKNKIRPPTLLYTYEVTCKTFITVERLVGEPIADRQIHKQTHRQILLCKIWREGIIKHSHKKKSYSGYSGCHSIVLLFYAIVRLFDLGSSFLMGQRIAVKVKITGTWPMASEPSDKKWQYRSVCCICCLFLNGI